MQRGDPQSGQTVEEGSNSRAAAASPRAQYRIALDGILATLQQHLADPRAGDTMVAARTRATDALLTSLWNGIAGDDKSLSNGVALIAIGGYGRSQLFPFSDVDLMILRDARVDETLLREPVRQLNQLLWDTGLRCAPVTRTLAECEKTTPENIEAALALLDARPLVGSPDLGARLLERSLPRLLSRDRGRIQRGLLELTDSRHARFGNTLFHLEPNVKETPGGLRDAHVCGWLRRLALPEGSSPPADPEFEEASSFLVLTRAFLHVRHGRDDNVLDWLAQDAAAQAGLGTGLNVAQPGVGCDAAYWMRLYFRHARVLDRWLGRLEEPHARARSVSSVASLKRFGRRTAEAAHAGFELRGNRILLTEPIGLRDPALEPEVVLGLFTAMAHSGAVLARETEQRLGDALPQLSRDLEDGEILWTHLAAILRGRHAGLALRTMHALGILELLIPEFHGIDALVIRDAYHRYTVDEHTFVLIDTLHSLGMPVPKGVPPTGLDAWSTRFGAILRDVQHPELLLLAALLHDTGKGHTGTAHAVASARMATEVVRRLELNSYEAGLVLNLVVHHLEMSATLRRDVFDTGTVSNFAAFVPTPEALRMLTLFTFADISAVHPDALTPWKAEDLYRLYLMTATFLDRHVDDERIATAATLDPGSGALEAVRNIHAMFPQRQQEIARYLEGLPRRYLETRTPVHFREHIEMAARVERVPGSAALDLRESHGTYELTVITRDRPGLFATVSGVLAGWGMNILTADAFSNAHGLVVDTFRFGDNFRTLELNRSERARLLASIEDVLAGRANGESLLEARRRGRRKAPRVKVETRIEFDQAASRSSTVVQVVAQDSPGLLRALSLTLAEAGANIEVALIDTEGEMAIDVFYLTEQGAKLTSDRQAALDASLRQAIQKNAG